ncbi:MAG: hypothetical protein WBB07_17550 [Mycobacterium sp.]
MNRAQRRAARLSNRPQMIPEQLREQYKNVPKVFNRQECIEYSAMLVANLEQILNSKEQLPWITCTTERRSDGFSLHVQVIEPTSMPDAEVTL